MQTSEPTIEAQAFSESIHTLTQSLAHFSEILDQEKTCLTSAHKEQAQTLLGLLDQKAPLINLINQQTQTLFEHARALAPEQTIDSLQSLLTLPLSSQQKQQVTQLIERSKMIQQKNRQNGQLIQALSHLNTQALHLLKGHSPTPPTLYSSKGVQYKPSLSNSLGKC